jgi:Peptidase family M28
MMRSRLIRALALASGLAVAAACGRQPALFSETNARAHVGMLAGTIGSRPVGTPANVRAREYIVDQLRLYGFSVRVQEADARRPEFGLTARVANVIATLEGTRPEALGLVAHYDSSPHAPGAADDGLGVAVALEAARVLAARPERPYSLMVLLTDAEEAGLMGAAALVTDREVTRRLQAYLQVEATGSDGPALLFESGPGNAWLVSAWAEHAPAPRGASFAADIYRRLPNDTDFSIIKRERIPGLNFAPVGDSYAYHTARDVPERLTSETLRTTGENIVATALALEATDLTQRSDAEPTFFDIAGTVAVHYGPVSGRLLTIAALLLAVVAWVRTLSAALRLEGVVRWLLTVVWTALGTAAVVAAMVGTTWALRAAREVYHPWYAHPRRLFVLLAVAGFLAGWGMTRAGAWLPVRARGHRHPLVVWTIALPVWLALACAALWFAPGSAFLVVLPLLVASLLLAVLPPTSDVALRAASLAIFAATASLWLPNTITLLDFLVPLFGRFPIVTPVFVFAALLTVAGVMLVPPLIGAFIAARRLLRPSAATAVALLALAVTAAAAYAAPAYTLERPLRRVVRVLQPDGADSAIWEVASTEPGLDLAPSAPTPWAPSPGDGPWPWTALPFPFVFRHSGPALPPAPAHIVTPSITTAPGGLELQLTVVPAAPGLRVSFALPPGLVPARHNLPGRLRDGAWVATYIAPAPDGLLFRASFDTSDPAPLQQVRVVVSSERIPGGDGWQSLPAWLPTDRSVWAASATWVLRPPFAPESSLR